MWIVRLALRRPYTFVVFALLIFILGPLAVLRTPTDIFPNINIPVISIVWQYAGLSPEEMTNRIVTPSERNLTTVVSDIEHLESQTMVGISVVKVYFHPGVNLSNVMSQVVGSSQTSLKQLPQGTTPPLIITYSASTVPILQLALSGPGLSEQQLNDFGQNFIRTQLATVEGAAVPFPYGGRQRQIQIDIDMPKLQAKGLSPNDIVSAFGSQNLVLPAGTAKVGSTEYSVESNSSPSTMEELNNIPIRVMNGGTVYISDVAHVRDGAPPQTNIVHVNNRRASLITVLKSGNASTLDIIAGVKDALPAIKSQLPPELDIKLMSDQSIFVRGAIDGVTREAIIAAVLTGLMILVFLGSWRSTIIIAVSIPLSILCSLIMLSALGETINIMTLGGLALAVGILVDDATVAIENINRHLEEGQGLEQSILDGSAEIAIPAFVSTISICIVFVPMFFLSGVAKYLFVPLAEAVVFAMLASYLLSRTVVPTMAKYLLKEHTEEEAAQKRTSRNPFVAFQRGFEAGFEKLRSGYYRLLELCVAHAPIFIPLFLLFAILTFSLVPWLGQDFFPAVDSGSFKFHMRARTGLRIEETAKLCAQIEDTIRQEVPANELVAITDNIGLPYSGMNTSYSSNGTISAADADIQVDLSEDHHPSDSYVKKLRAVLNKKYPGVLFYTLPVDITTQILNFGLSSPIDIQIQGSNLQDIRGYADMLLNEVRYVPGAVDVRIHQPFNNPRLNIDVDRVKAQNIGLTQRDVAGSLLTALSGSFQTTPVFYINPKTGVSYNIAVQTPQYLLDSMQKLRNIPITKAGAASTNSTDPVNLTGATPVQILGNVASFSHGAEMATFSHYNVRPVLDIFANVSDSDLGSVSTKIEKILADHKKDAPRGTVVVLRGQTDTMRKSFQGLLFGLVFSILLVYLLIVVNFQSWLDPFIIISALPAALAGIIWMLFLTGTRLSVPALTGSIMCMGVATANSILVVNFARDQMEVLMGDARKSALQSGFTRFRPVLMTALAMIIGMIPMSLGLGEGGEQNAPLGRAVIGGLLFATVATLFFVPSFFSLIHGYLNKRRPHTTDAVSSEDVDEFNPESGFQSGPVEER